MQMCECKHSCITSPPLFSCIILMAPYSSLPIQLPKVSIQTTYVSHYSISTPPLLSSKSQWLLVHLYLYSHERLVYKAVYSLFHFYSSPPLLKIPMAPCYLYSYQRLVYKAVYLCITLFHFYSSPPLLKITMASCSSLSP